MTSSFKTRSWAILTEEQRTEYLVEFGYFQDQLQPTCSMDEKNARLRDWLMHRGIVYPDED